MTARSTPSPEDRFNAYLDALASGKSTPETSDAVADTNADPSMPAETARELHDLARAADARQGDPPESIWETIMNATFATAPPLAPNASPEQQAPSPGIRTLPIERRRRRPTHPFAWLNAVAAAVLLLGLAAGWYFSAIGPGGSGGSGDDGHLAALPAMNTGTPVAASEPFTCSPDTPHGPKPPVQPSAQLVSGTTVSSEGIWAVIPPDGRLRISEEYIETSGEYEEWRGTKMMWTRGDDAVGPLIITGERLDAEAPDAVDLVYLDGRQYGTRGFTPSWPTFPSAGCWEITGTVGDHELVFTLEVVFVASGADVPATPVAARPGVDPVLVAEGWFSNWYEVPMPFGP